jgi:hypothetical protein
MGTISVSSFSKACDGDIDQLPLRLGGHGEHAMTPVQAINIIIGHGVRTPNAIGQNGATQVFQMPRPHTVPTNSVKRPGCMSSASTSRRLKTAPVVDLKNRVEKRTKRKRQERLESMRTIRHWKNGKLPLRMLGETTSSDLCIKESSRTARGMRS